jgi:hypothetical protein
LVRRFHPNRLRFRLFADDNPLVHPVRLAADWVRDNRRHSAPDNPFLTFERMLSGLIGEGLKAWGEARDAMQEAVFFNVYGSPILQAMVGLRADGAAAGHGIERDLMREAIARQMAARLERQIEEGGLIEAALRAMMYVRRPEGKIDERGFAALKEISAALPAAKHIGFARLKDPD